MRTGEEEKRREIINSIHRRPKGISELVKETGHDKKTVRKYCKQLVQEGLVEKSGRFGKYHLTDKAYQYPSIRANLFRTEAMSKIFRTSTNDVYYNREFVEFDAHNKASTLLALNLANKAEIMEYVVKIGSFIVYSLIKFMAPKVWIPKIDNIPLQQELSAKERDKAITEAIENIINPLDIAREFCNLHVVAQGLHRGSAIEPPAFNIFLKKIIKSTKYRDLSPALKETLEKDVKKIWNNWRRLYETRKKMNLDPSHPRFEMDEKVYKNLIKAYKELFPDTYHKLEEASNFVDDEIKRQVSLATDPNHVKCKCNERKLVRKSNFETIEQCIECKRYFNTQGP